MPKFQFNVKVASGFEVDAVLDHMIFEIKRDMREVSRLRGTLWKLAQIAEANPNHRVILLLLDAELSLATMRSAWASVAQIVRPDLAARISIWLLWQVDGANLFEGFPKPLREEDKALLMELVASVGPVEHFRGPKHGDSRSEVLRLLLCRWLREERPVNLTEIGELLGYTFKPVRAALDSLERYLVLHGKQGVTLGSFPREPWARLVHNAQAIRGTIHFVDRAQSGRSVESLLQRVRRLGLTDVAVGGVAGARHYDADLDLIGLPRLDLCIHARTAKPDLGFIRNLDPGLVAETSPGQTGSLAIHFLHRKASLFDQGTADPVECLLDLHEMRLEHQALQFLRSFPAAQKESF